MYKSIFKSTSDNAHEDVASGMSMEAELLAIDILDVKTNQWMAQETILSDGAQRLESVYTECKEAIDAGQCTPVLMDQFVKRTSDITQGSLILRGMTEESFSDEVDRNDAYTMTNESLSGKIAEIWKAIKEQTDKILNGIMDLFAKLFSNYTKLGNRLSDLYDRFEKSDIDFGEPVKITAGMDELHYAGKFEPYIIGSTLIDTELMRKGLGKLAIEYDKAIGDLIISNDPNATDIANRLITSTSFINTHIVKAQKTIFAGGVFMENGIDENVNDSDPIDVLFGQLPNVEMFHSLDHKFNGQRIDLTVENVLILLSGAQRMVGSLMKSKNDLKELSKNRKRVVNSFDNLIKQQSKDAGNSTWSKSQLNSVTRLINNRIVSSYKKIVAYEYRLCRAAESFATAALIELESDNK